MNNYQLANRNVSEDSYKVANNRINQLVNVKPSNKVNTMKTTKITLKSKKGSEKEHAHTDVYYNNQFIGYITSPEVNTVGGIWHFSSKSRNFANISAVTKKALLDRLKY